MLDILIYSLNRETENTTIFSYEVAESFKEYVHFALCFEGAEFVKEK